MSSSSAERAPEETEPMDVEMEMEQAQAPQLQAKFNYADLEELVRIELPVFVESADRGLELMGGAEVVGELVREPAAHPLQFRFPSANPHRSNLVASSKKTNGILVRLRRSKSSQSVTVLGGVSTSFQFTSPADYQFLPASVMSANKHIHASRVLDALPSDFCKERQIRGYQFFSLSEGVRKDSEDRRKAAKSKSAGAAGVGVGAGAAGTGSSASARGGEGREDEDEGVGEGADAGTVNKRNQDKGMTYYLNMDEEVPQQHQRGAHPPQWTDAASDHRGLVLLRQLRRLFSIIPSKNPLRSALCCSLLFSPVLSCSLLFSPAPSCSLLLSAASL
jgi:hypothetical protein